MRFRLLILTAVLMVSMFGLANGQNVLLDHVDGVDGSGYLVMDTSIYFHIRIQNDENANSGITNGYKIYSPQGADWGEVLDPSDTLADGSPGHRHTWAAWDPAITYFVFESKFVTPQSCDGVDADTIGLGAFRMMIGTGLVANYDDIPYVIEIGAIGEEDQGKQICMDSAFYPPSGVWKWAGPTTYPDWEGPYCWTIGEESTDPVLLAVDPNSAQQGQTVTVEITGQHTEFTLGNESAVLTYEEYAIYPTTHPVINDTAMSATFEIPPDAPLGLYDVGARYGEGEGLVEVWLIEGFTVMPPPPAIACPETTVEAFLCGSGQACVDLVIENPGEVTVEGATWSDNTLCFDVGETQRDEYTFTVTATNSSGSDECEITVNVTLNEPPTIVAQDDTSLTLCEPQEICVSYVPDDPNGTDGLTETMIAGFGDFDADNDQACFTPETAGEYTFIFGVSDPCSEEARDTVIVTVEFLAVPEIACPTEPISVPVTEASETCVDMMISGRYDDVAVEYEDETWYATYSDGGFCFDATEVGEYAATVIASNACGADSCDVTVLVVACPPPVITCPEEPVVVEICELGEVCVDLPVDGATEVTVEGATWTEGQLCFTPEAVGDFDFNVTATNECGSDQCALTVSVVITQMELSDTEFHFVMYESDLENPLPEELVVSTTGSAFCYEFLTEGDEWLILDPASGGCSGDAISVGVDGLDLVAGEYETEIGVYASELTCEPRWVYFKVYLDVLIPPSDDDIIAISTIPAVPGSSVALPVTIENLCSLSALTMRIDKPDDALGFDSISWIGSVVEDWSDKDFHEGEISARMSGGEDPVPAGTDLLITAWFTIQHDAAAGFYPVVRHTGYDVIFEYDCGSGTVSVIPTVIDGGIVVGTADNYVCGYVVDPDYNPIEGATVELWDDFPTGTIDDDTHSDATGLFQFFDSEVIPYDLWAYKEGYYPGKVENLNFAQTGIMIILTPIEPITPTDEWVNFYCGANLYMGGDLPVGSVVDAVDPDGVRCGSFTVTQAGKYGFLPVYHDDPYSGDIDEGAESGDMIRLYVNGLEAVTSEEPIWTSNGVATEICLDAGSPVVHECDLYEGWNLVSWPVDHTSDDITVVMSSISGCLEAVLGFEDGGLTYDPEEPQFSTLAYVDHLSGYWIKVSCDITLRIEGYAVPTSTPITLNDGWNLVSYLPDATLPTETALASIHDDLIVALGGDGEGLVYKPGDDLHNTLVEMSTCNGYWLKVTQAGQLIYPGAVPAPVGQMARELFASKAAAEDMVATTSWMNLYSHELTLDGDPVPAGATVTAHRSDGTKIGSFTLDQNGLFGFMPVYGDDPTTAEVEGAEFGEVFHLRVDGVETDEEFVWTGQATKTEIESLTSTAASAGVLPTGVTLSQNYPNPFNPTTTIAFSMPTAGKARLEVFNILGRRVAVPFDGMANAGQNEVIWNGTNSAGQTVASGIYFYRLTANNHTETRKMTLLK